MRILPVAYYRDNNLIQMHLQASYILVQTCYVFVMSGQIHVKEVKFFTYVPSRQIF